MPQPLSPFRENKNDLLAGLVSEARFPRKYLNRDILQPEIVDSLKKRLQFTTRYAMIFKLSWQGEVCHSRDARMTNSRGGNFNGQVL